VQISQLFLAVVFRVEQRCHNDQHLRAEARLFDTNASFASGDLLWHRSVGFAIDVLHRRLGPVGDVIVLAKTLAASKIRLSHCFVQPRDRIDSSLLERKEKNAKNIRFHAS